MGSASQKDLDPTDSRPEYTPAEAIDVDPGTVQVSRLDGVDLAADNPLGVR